MDTVKDYAIKTLNGMSIAIAIALLPSAVLGELLLFLSQYTPVATTILDIVNFCARMLPFTIGICVASQYKMDAISTLSVGFAATIASGVIVSIDKGSYTFSGTGDVINAGLISCFSVWMTRKYLSNFKVSAVIIIPIVVSVIGGLIGMFTLPYVSLISRSIGDMINYFTTLQPVLMGMLIAMAFTCIIVSPISTVGIAYSIGISGIAATAANIGVSVAAVVFAVFCYQDKKTLGLSLIQLIGTPKMQLANFAKKPQMLIPGIIVSGVMGIITGAFGFEMPTKAAGFGVIGGIGPVALMNSLGWSPISLVIMICYFFVLPISLGMVLRKYFFNKNKLCCSDYFLEY